MNVDEFRTLIDKCTCMEDVHIVLNSILDEYVILEREYEELEHQKLETMMPAIENIIGTKTNAEEIEYLKTSIQMLKIQLGKHVEERRNLELELTRLGIEYKISEKQLSYFKEKNIIVTKNYYVCETCTHEWSYVRAERQISDCPCCKRRHIYPKHRKILTY